MTSSESSEGQGDGGQDPSRRTSSPVALTKEVEHSMNSLELGDKCPSQRHIRRRRKSSGAGTMQVAVREDPTELALAAGATGTEFACQADADIGLMTLEQLRTYSLLLTHQYNGLKTRHEREQERQYKLLGIINSLAKRGHKHPCVQRIGGDPKSKDVGADAVACETIEKHDKATNSLENTLAKDTVRVVPKIPDVSTQVPVSSPSSRPCPSPLFTAVRNRISESEEDGKNKASAPPDTADAQLVKVGIGRNGRTATQEQQWTPTKIYGQYQYRFEVIIPSPGHLFVPKRSIAIYFASNPTCGTGLCVVEAQNSFPSRYYTFRQSHTGLRGPTGIWPPISQAEIEMHTCFTGLSYFRNWFRVGDDLQIWTDSTALHWDNFPPFATFKEQLTNLQYTVGCRVRLFHDVPIQNIYLKVAHMLTTYSYYPHQESPYMLLQSLGILPGSAHSVLRPL